MTDRKISTFIYFYKNFSSSDPLQNWYICLAGKPIKLYFMKKLLFIAILMMAALVVNAQATKTTVTNAKSTRTAVKVTELQKAITDNVAKDYAGFTIKEATSVTTNTVVTYDVVITKGTTTETLVYDKDGKFVKKVTQKVVAPVQKTAAPAPKK
jgi:hypothetical protein